MPMSRARICSTPSASGNRPPDSAHTTNGRQLGDVVGEVVGEEPADVGERRPALLARRRRCVAKSSSSSTRSAASRATSVPDRPIATPMSASRRAGAVVDPVAGHRHHVARAPAAPGRCGACPRGSTRAITTPSRSTSAPELGVVVGEVGARRPRARRRPSSPTSVAMAARVAGWSPVTIATWMPARPALRDAPSPTSARGGSWSATSPQQLEVATRPSSASAGGRAGPTAADATASTRRPSSRQGVAARSAAARSAPPTHRGSTRVGRALARAAHRRQHRLTAATAGSNGNRRLRVARRVGVGVDPQPAGEDVERGLHRVTVRHPRAVGVGGEAGASTAPRPARAARARRAPPGRRTATVAVGS